MHYARPPLALWGGYEDWMLKYPALTTNPQAVPPRQVDSMEDMLGKHKGVSTCRVIKIVYPLTQHDSWQRLCLGPFSKETARIL